MSASVIETQKLGLINEPGRKELNALLPIVSITESTSLRLLQKRENEEGGDFERFCHLHYKLHFVGSDTSIE